VLAFVCTNLLFFDLWFYSLGYGDGLRVLLSPVVTIFLVLSVILIIGMVVRLQIWLPLVVGFAAGLGTAYLASLLLIFLGAAVAFGG